MGMPPDSPLTMAWRRLGELAARPDGSRITPLFAADPARATRFAHRLDDLILDLSKSSIDDAALAGLFDLARAAGLENFRSRLFGGVAVNATEGRAATGAACPIRATPTAWRA